MLNVCRRLVHPISQFVAHQGLYSVRKVSNISKHVEPIRCISSFRLYSNISRIISKKFYNPTTNGSTSLQAPENNNILQTQAKRFLPTLNQIRRKKPRTKKKRAKVVLPPERRILLGPQRKAVCVKCVVRTPRKPNSAQRKCAVLRLSDGRLITAYIPGEKSNLQEHGVVLFRGGRVQDCPGLKYKIIRGVYDMN